MSTYSLIFAAKLLSTIKTGIKFMNRRIKLQLTTTLFIFFLLLANQNLFAQNGEQLFKANCAACHKPDEAYVGPPLKGAKDREPSKDWVYKWVPNTTTMLNTDAYAKQLFATYKIQMTPFPDLKKADIDAILDYANNYKPPTPTTGGPVAQPQSDNTLLYGLLTAILAIIGFVLLQVNSNLKKLADEKDGFKPQTPVPFYRNKAYILMVLIVLFLIGGYYLVEAAMGLGRQQGYQPVQPIFYSHKVHAGVNQISCLYCHTGAQDSKHANVPSVNVCMNCHKAINEYKGDPLYREDGTQVDANAEIKKLYKYAGWDPDTKTYDQPGKPISWVRIHSLPDFVYFNHSQHVKVGKVQCQTCHGEIQKMDEVHQFADLSMGWCVNCHRTTNVQFNDDQGHGNKFYSIYEKFHEDIKNHKYDSVTVEKIGGINCGKCHY